MIQTISQEDELVNKMLADTMFAAKIGYLRGRSTTSSELKVLYKNAYKKYRKLRINQLNDDSNKKVQSWHEKYPKSFKYRSPEEICELINTHQSCYKLAWRYSYNCGSNKRLKKDLINRTIKGLILYYQKYEPKSYKVYKLLARLEVL